MDNDLPLEEVWEWERVVPGIPLFLKVYDDVEGYVEHYPGSKDPLSSYDHHTLYLDFVVLGNDAVSSEDLLRCAEAVTKTSLDVEARLRSKDKIVTAVAEWLADLTGEPRA